LICAGYLSWKFLVEEFPNAAQGLRGNVTELDIAINEDAFLSTAHVDSLAPSLATRAENIKQMNLASSSFK
jgi:hypothetical protein